MLLVMLLFSYCLKVNSIFLKHSHLVAFLVKAGLSSLITLIITADDNMTARWRCVLQCSVV